MFVNRMPRYEVLDPDAIATLERGWKRILTDVGVAFGDPEAVALLRAAGQRVEGEVAFLDPEFVLEQVALAPAAFDLQARNPEQSVRVGGDAMVFASVYGCPFVREGDIRREGTMDDFERLVKLSHAFPQIDSPGGVICEPGDRPLDSRHLDLTFAQQTAEAFAGIALTQLVRPGCPVVLGSFLSNTDMQSGSPGFGGPESAVGLLCTGQLARHYGLPWRAGGGGLTSSQTVDAQAAYDALNTMLPAFLAGANLVMHAAGWLESGLVSCFEKFIVDIELLRVLREEFTPLRVDEESLAL